MSKTITTRIAHKIDLEINWRSIQFIPMKGELIIFAAEIDENGNELAHPEERAAIPYARMKIGDGIHDINDDTNLPFFGGTSNSDAVGVNDYIWEKRTKEINGGVKITEAASISTSTQSNISPMCFFTSDTFPEKIERGKTGANSEGLGFYTGNWSLVQVAYNNSNPYSILKKYFYFNGLMNGLNQYPYTPTIYEKDADSSFEVRTEAASGVLYLTNLTQWSAQQVQASEHVEYVTSEEPDAYVSDENFDYILIGKLGDIVNAALNSSAMPITGGTFTGVAKAQANTSYTTYQMRNIALSTTAGLPTGNGSILGVYS